MRLAFCNATRSWGGVKTWTIEFAVALQSRGHDITLYGRPGTFIDRAQEAGLNAVPVNFGPDFNPLAIKLFYTAFKKNGTQAVLVNVGRDLRTAGIAARLAGIPLIQRIGLPGDMRNSAKVRLLHRFLRPQYLCPCRYIRDGLREALPFIRIEDTTVIHSAKTPASNAPSTVSTPLRLITTSQVNPNKGHEELMRALATLRDEGFAFTWDIAGTGDSVSQLQTLAQALSIADRITWHGFTQNVTALLDSCDVFVLPSYTEGLPNTLLEGMARGLIPVSRNVGGVAELWPDSLAPLLVPDMPRNGKALTDTLRWVFVTPPEQLLAWKQKSWETCVQTFSLESQAAKLEHFFAERIGVTASFAPNVTF